MLLRITIRRWTAAVAVIAGLLGLGTAYWPRLALLREAETAFQRSLGGQLSRSLTGAQLADLRSDYISGYVRGCTEADLQIAKSEATIYTYGLRAGLDNLDRETGLPVEAIAGCVVDETTEGRAAGHNARIQRYIKSYGLPSNSLKPWETELFDLRGFFEARWKAGQSIHLRAGGPAAISPDGNREVVLMERSVRGNGKELRASIRVCGNRSGTDIYLFSDRNPVELVWGPTRAGFAVLQGYTDNAMYYEAVDLRAGAYLRGEHYTIAPPKDCILLAEYTRRSRRIMRRATSEP
jgi:hypothetical protein